LKYGAVVAVAQVILVAITVLFLSVALAEIMLYDL
jgi:hypothetical protein